MVSGLVLAVVIALPVVGATVVVFARSWTAALAVETLEVWAELLFATTFDIHCRIILEQHTLPLQTIGRPRSKAGPCFVRTR